MPWYVILHNPIIILIICILFTSMLFLSSHYKTQVHLNVSAKTKTKTSALHTRGIMETCFVQPTGSLVITEDMVAKNLVIFVRSDTG